MNVTTLPAWTLGVGLLVVASASAAQTPVVPPPTAPAPSATADDELPPTEAAADVEAAAQAEQERKAALRAAELAQVEAFKEGVFKEDALKKDALKSDSVLQPYQPSSEGGVSEFVWSFVKSMLMLGVVLALIYLLLHKGLGQLVKRTQSGKRMRVVERITLDQKRALYLVELDGEEVLLAGSEGGVVRVDRPIPESDAGAAPAARQPFTTDVPRSTTPPLTGVLHAQRDDSKSSEEAA